MERKLTPVAKRQVLTQLWKLADELERVAGRLRQADTPSQLYEPITNTLTAVRGIRMVRHDWLNELYGWPKQFQEHWPY